jgi:hypothetical protein
MAAPNGSEPSSVTVDRIGTYAHLMPADHDRARSAVEAAFRLARHDRVIIASPVPETTL